MFFFNSFVFSRGDNLSGESPTVFIHSPRHLENSSNDIEEDIEAVRNAPGRALRLENIVKIIQAKAKSRALAAMAKAEELQRNR